MAVKDFKNYLKEFEITNIKVIESEENTDTAQAAADVHGVPVSNIVKSLVVTDDLEYFVVLVPGDKKLDLEKISKERDDDMRMALADEVKNATGFSIGGVPPFGHKKELITYIDEGFNEDEELVAAAGASNAVFKVTYERLLDLTKAIKL